MDYSKLSDSELLDVARQRGLPAKPNYSAMSDEDLTKLAQQRGLPVSQGNFIDRAGRYVDNLGRQFAGGTLANLADEFSAGMTSLTGIGPQYVEGGDNSYSAILERERNRDKAFQNENPVASIGANIAGGVANPVMRMAGAAVNAPTLAGRAMQSAVVGAGTGAAFGFGGGEGGFKERAKDAAGGLVLGGALGGAMPYAVEGVSAGARALARPVLDRMGPADAGARRVARALERDKMTPQALSDRLRELGPDAMPADAGGANLRGLAEVIAQSPGKGSEAAQVLQSRMEGQGQRIADSVNRGLSGRDIIASADDLAAQRTTQARPIYERSVNPGNLIPDEQFASIAGDDFMQGVFKRVQGDPLLGMKDLPPNSMPVVDAVKKNLDDMISTAQRAGENNRARLLIERRDALVQMADQAFPDYAAARSAWAGPSQSMDAMQAGRDFAKVDPRTLAQQMQGMGDGEREFFRAGVADKIKEMIASTKDGADATRRIFGTDRIRQQIQAVFPDEQSFQAFAKEMEREALFAQSRNQMLRGSPTFGRQAAEADLMAAPANDAVGLLLAGRPVAAAAEGTRSLATKLRRPPESVRSELAELLFAQGGGERVLQALGKRAEVASLSEARRRSLARLLMEGGGTASGYAVTP